MTDTIIGSGDPIAVAQGQTMTTADLEKATRHHIEDVRATIVNFPAWVCTACGQLSTPRLGAKDGRGIDGPPTCPDGNRHDFKEIDFKNSTDR